MGGKRQKKNEKYGFGGRKRGMKKNDSESVSDMSAYKRQFSTPDKVKERKRGRPILAKPSAIKLKNFKPKRNVKKNRPGKSKRKTQMSK